LADTLSLARMRKTALKPDASNLSGPQARALGSLISHSMVHWQLAFLWNPLGPGWLIPNTPTGHADIWCKVCFKQNRGAFELVPRSALPQLSRDGAHRVLLAVARWSRSELNNYKAEPSSRNLQVPGPQRLWLGPGR
jgi:hypothetical protein